MIVLLPNADGDIVHRLGATCGSLKLRPPMTFVSAAEILTIGLWPCAVCLKGPPWRAIRETLLGSRP